MAGFPCIITQDAWQQRQQRRQQQQGRRSREIWEEGEEDVVIHRMGNPYNRQRPHAPQRDRINSLLSHCEVVYKSDMHPHKDKWDDGWSYFQLPAGVIGNVVTLTLVGKNFRQYPTSGFYACVQEVGINGFPLFTHSTQLDELDPQMKSWFLR